MSLVYSSLNHPARVPLAAEVHSRPYLRLEAPEILTHIAVYARSSEDPNGIDAALQHATLAALCEHFGVTPPVPEATYFSHDFGRFRLKWECHTEFATYTFAERRGEEVAIHDAFKRVPLHHLPQAWLQRLQGMIMVATHLVLDRQRQPVESFAKGLPQIFEGGVMVGSKVLQGAELWTDFLIQSDGFSRFVVRDIDLREQQAGRLVQRVLEIETYRMMALLGLPQARAASPLLNGIESELATLTAEMVDTDSLASADNLASNTDKEQELLGTITGLAARIEKLSLHNSYRFSASHAYFGLVAARIEELREERLEGFPTVSEFMERRLTPARNTCAAISRRQEALAERIAHTNDLLRTRVGILQERQNRQILQSMNARAAQQLRLQQAVEGLSVAAISYYVAGLFNYGGKAMKAAGIGVNPELLTGILIPVIAAAVWLGLRRLHRGLHAE